MSSAVVRKALELFKDDLITETGNKWVTNKCNMLVVY